MSSGDHATPADLTLERRLKLLHGGYSPVPLLSNKRPILDAWQTRHDVTEHEIRSWDMQLPAAVSTGVLTRFAPFLDVDILDEEAVRAIEDHVFARYDARGSLMARIGLPPKRGFLFQTAAPFQKILVKVVASRGGEERVEFLGDGQMAVIFGLHPAIGRPYRWFGGEPGDIARAALPLIGEAEARALVDELVRILVDHHGYRRETETPHTRGNGAGGGDTIGWIPDLIDHDELAAYAMKVLASGMHSRAAANFLREAVRSLKDVDEERRQRRLVEIPSMVKSARNKLDREAAEAKTTTTPGSKSPGAEVKAEEQGPPTSPTSIAQVLDVFDSWLVLKSATPILAMLGAVAGNLLPGEPVWLGLIGPPSSAKTEILMSAAQLRDVVQATTLTCAALLSGTPRHQRDKTAKGGLLRQIGEFGILSLKDFGSVLSMHSETRAELLAMLREVYDGSVTRHFGIDGGKTLTWGGKVGVIFAATPIIDTYYGVIGSMGDRFLMCRLPPTGKGQGPRALKHRGAVIAQMRKELAQAVAGLFAGRKTEPAEITDAETKWLEDVILLAVRLRGAVERDRRTREMEMVLGAEGPARLMLTLERLLAGLDTLGVERQAALDVVESVAMDSVPPVRLAAYRCVEDLIGQGEAAVETAGVATRLGLPTNTVRRVLEDLAAYRLVRRESGGQGNADRWLKTDWETD